MSDEKHQYNQSIVVTGGTVSGALAAGDHASAAYHRSSTPGADLGPLLAELRDLVERNRTTVDDATRVLRDTADLLAAASGREPDRDRIRETLARIAARGGALVAVAEVVEKTRELVGRMF